MDVLKWLMQNWGIIVRWFIYIAIAVLTTIVAETGVSEMPKVWAVTVKAVLNGLIAWRAFLDESMAWAKINNKNE